MARSLKPGAIIWVAAVLAALELLWLFSYYGNNGSLQQVCQKTNVGQNLANDGNLEIIQLSDVKPPSQVDCKTLQDHRQIRVFIVIYKDLKNLQRLLLSIAHSDLLKHTHEVVVINNYGCLKDLIERIRAENSRLNLRIIDNSVRPDFATGHLARDWNTALIQGFKDLDDPISDVVVLMQGDTNVKASWASTLWDHHINQNFSFLQAGAGDEIHSYTAEAVRDIGIWDERFCGIGFQEADYFFRAKCSNVNIMLNDYHHGRWVHAKDTLSDQVLGPGRSLGVNSSPEEHHRANAGGGFHIGRHFLHVKFDTHGHYHAFEGCPIAQRYEHCSDPLVPTFMFYPYFEKKIRDLEKKKYMFPPPL